MKSWGKADTTPGQECVCGGRLRGPWRGLWRDPAMQGETEEGSQLKQPCRSQVQGIRKMVQNRFLPGFPQSASRLVGLFKIHFVVKYIQYKKYHFNHG